MSKDATPPPSLGQAANIAVFTDEYVGYQKVIVDHIASIMSQSGFGTLCITGRELIPKSGDRPAYAVCNATYELVKQYRTEGLICLGCLANVGS